MKNKTLLTLFSIIMSFVYSESQNGNWETYLAMYEKGVGSTIVDMSLINKEIKELKNIVITGVTFKKCNKDGLPKKEQFKKLYEISDKIQAEISKRTNARNVGSFTYQCERLDYTYVKDTTKIREVLLKVYNDSFSEYDEYINIKSDKDWEAYNEFLYPNPETMEYISNLKVLDQLEKAGDDLTKKRKIDHWIYFTDNDKMNEFIKFSEKIGFKTESKDKIESNDANFRLRISRVDKVDIQSISDITLMLRKKVQELEGDYDGWETIVIKN